MPQSSLKDDRTARTVQADFRIFQSFLAFSFSAVVGLVVWVIPVFNRKVSDGDAINPLNLSLFVSCNGK